MIRFGLAVACLAAPVRDPVAQQWLDEFFASWSEVRTMTYQLRKQERSRQGELTDETVAVKLRRPLAVYLAALRPRPGQEVIYDSRVDRAHLTVHPGRFPDFTLSLEIEGALAMRGQHHPVSHSGLSYLVQQLRFFLAWNADAVRLTDGGDGRVSGRSVHWVRLRSSVDPKRLWARSDESLFRFAERVGGDPYWIYCANPEIDDVTDRLAGRAYWVPQTYGARIDLALDCVHGLPVRVVVWDEQGNLFEQLDFTAMEINPPLTDLDFDPSNPAYGF